MSDVKEIVVTGATGFIGKALCRILLEKGYLVTAVFRTKRNADNFKKMFSSSALKCEVVGEITNETNWDFLHSGINAIIHLAARVHMIQENISDPLEEYRRINVLGTEQLAKRAVIVGIKRFIFISSIGVNGSCTLQESFTEKTRPNPHSAYAISKWEAEQVLSHIAQTTNLELVILRPPLVYGRGVKANFRSLLSLVKMGLPLPLAKVNNRRSLIYVENLIDAIIACLISNAAIGKTYLVSDDESVSTVELIQIMAKAIGKKPRLWSFPIKLLLKLGKVTGKTAVLNRLLGSLIVDNSKIKQELNWHPPFSIHEAMQRDFSKKD